MVFGALLMTGATITAGILVMQVAVLPLLFKYSKRVPHKMVFSNCLNYPRNLDYENPSSCDIVGGRHFNIEFVSRVDNCLIKIGAWHIVPCSMFADMCVIRDYNTVDQRIHEQFTKTTQPIVLYFHGNANHRASPPRIQTYRLFQDLDFHVITFDYRGYGDSTQVKPTERGVVEDAYQVYSWVLKNINQEKPPPVMLWGHSLGTAIAANLVANMADYCRDNSKECLPQPHALVLEAPFNNLLEEIEKHPFSKLVSWLPYYKETFVHPFLTSSDYSFTTDEYLSKVPDLPILILHSEADKVVPHELGEKLFESVTSSRKKTTSGGAPIVLHSFEKTMGLGHNNLCLAPNLIGIVREFMNDIEESKINYKEEKHVV